ncbi:MAG TPA: SusC/RagA family TonB-linked outer membrane protein, partial [Bacteroidales bacterium]|nr:SusC/RagA family TonB-linked outer membrane protein [Bacteroidales bacterium]
MKKILMYCSFVFLLMMLLPLTSFAQVARTITGKVTDPGGMALPGTNIVVQGTSTGVQADANGNYQISVENPANAILEFSFIGYAKQQVPVRNLSTINVVLQEEYIGLNELVVVGYGTVRKKDLTGSVASIKSTEITKTATNNALQSMQGKIAGLDITKTSGESGSGIRIDLRGNRSINASNTPLFLVDGIEYGSTLDLNASDIQSIEVLKDASSTAIYGTRGANGVVIITTKKGLSGAAAGKSRVTINSYLSFNSPTNLPKIMSVEQDYLLIAERQRYNAEKGTAAWGTTNLSSYTPEIVLSNIISAPYEKSVYQLYNEGGVNWFDLILRNSLTHNHEIALSGGDAKTSFVISLGYMNEQGLLRNDMLSRYNGRINLDHKIKSNLTVGANLQYTFRNWDRRDDNVYSQLIKMHSMAQPYLADGTILDRPSELAISHTNPLLNEVPGYYKNNTQSNRLFGNLFLEWELLKGLKFKSVFGLDQQSSRAGEY